MTISGYRLIFKLHGGTHHVLVSKPSISDNIGCPNFVTNSATDHAGGHLNLGLTNRLVVTLRASTTTVLEVVVVALRRGVADRYLRIQRQKRLIGG